MARKPVHLTVASRHPQGRQVIWEAIRKLRLFRIADLEEHTRIREATLKTYVTGLTAAGYLVRADEEMPASEQRYQPGVWKLVRDTGVEAPRVRKNGTAVTQGLGREQLWRTMRIIGEFTFRELAVQASTEETPVSLEDAKHYCRYLERAGYLVVTAEARGSKPARYRLLPSRYTGPHPPQLQRVRQLWDPNLQRVVWSAQGGER
jgi:hypothetical protein